MPTYTKRDLRSVTQALDDAFEDMAAVRSRLDSMGAVSVLADTEAVMDGLRAVRSRLLSEGWVRE
jgi:hypothetical protein